MTPPAMPTSGEVAGTAGVEEFWDDGSDVSATCDLPIWFKTETIVCGSLTFVYHLRCNRIHIPNIP